MIKRVNGDVQGVQIHAWPLMNLNNYLLKYSDHVQNSILPAHCISNCVTVHDRDLHGSRIVRGRVTGSTPRFVLNYFSLKRCWVPHKLPLWLMQNYQFGHERQMILTTYFR